ncbi:TIGR03943 family protein [Actinoplanes sp. NBRC 103695]|uniref:TIGR03943 family putative permease subunit n=1 Tax=Actinoplanes sp. NBRC 103695 TaxID=3032202 RepID=UPI00249FAE14|nr:TIGR03943 family protein [Actinoplanes sp. NBRC 103695]GLY95221.1 membrane protein [Actinoplanes sp. NBRC 103695]
MNRQAQGVILLLLGGAIVKAGITDLSLRYVKEGLRPFLVAAGLLLVAAAVMTLWYDLRPARATAASSPSPQDGDDHHHEPRVGWLLLLPVLGLLLVAPPALGSDAAGRSGSVLAAAPSDAVYPALPPGDPVPVSLLDYASRAVFDEGRTLRDRTVRLTGFVAPGRDGQPMLVRMVLSCCAADGRPIKVALTGDVPSGLPPDTWVHADGTWVARTAADEINQAAVPYLEVRSWQRITAPRQQYE